VCMGYTLPVCGGMLATRSRYLPMSDTLPDATRLIAKSLCDMKPVF